MPVLDRLSQYLKKPRGSAFFGCRVTVKKLGLELAFSLRPSITCRKNKNKLTTTSPRHHQRIPIHTLGVA
jgi:hypothetical protein